LRWMSFGVQKRNPNFEHRQGQLAHKLECKMLMLMRLKSMHRSKLSLILKDAQVDASSLAHELVLSIISMVAGFIKFLHWRTGTDVKTL
jgi:hypothetical protein